MKKINFQSRNHIFINIKFLFSFLFLFSLVYANNNLGHRLGGDIYKPENTLYSYEKALSLLQNKKNFFHIEFDIRESKDGELIVFHDQKISRVVPDTKHNRNVLKTILKKKSFNQIYIKDLKAKTITRLLLKNNASIPTLEDVLQFSLLHDVKKPIYIEIKKIDTDYARAKMIELVAKYSETLNIIFIAFSKNFYVSFPNPERWIKYFQKYNLRVYQIGRYEFTQAPIDQKSFIVLLPERSFKIIKNNHRIQKFSITIPPKIRKEDYVKLGIYHGADNSGDKGVSFKVKNLRGYTLLEGFSRSKTWEWFTLKNISSSRVFNIFMEDNDTIFTGKHPGNKGKLKVILIQK